MPDKTHKHNQSIAQGQWLRLGLTQGTMPYHQLVLINHIPSYCFVMKRAFSCTTIELSLLYWCGLIVLNGTT